MSMSSTAADPMSLFKPLIWVVIGSFALGAFGTVVFKSTHANMGRRTISPGI